MITKVGHSLLQSGQFFPSPPPSRPLFIIYHNLSCIFKLNMPGGFWATPLLIFMSPVYAGIASLKSTVHTACLRKFRFVLYLQNLGLYTSRRFHLVKGHHVWSLICCPLFIYGKLPKYDYHEAIVKVCLSQSQRCAAALSAFLKETTFTTG